MNEDVCRRIEVITVWNAIVLLGVIIVAGKVFPDPGLFRVIVLRGWRILFSSEVQVIFPMFRMERLLGDCAVIVL